MLLVVSFAARGFSLDTPVFPSPQKPTLPNSNSIVTTPKGLLGKQLTYIITTRGFANNAFVRQKKLHVVVFKAI